MTMRRPAHIEAALLYDNYDPFTYTALVKQLELLFDGHWPIELGAFRDGIWGEISVGEHVVKITQNDHPLRPEGFASCLAAPSTQMRFPQAADAVNFHNMNIFLTVGDGDTKKAETGPELFELSPPDASITPQRPKPEPSLDTFSDRVFVARVILDHLIRINTPTAVHWCQSNQIFRPEELDINADPTGMTVQINPSYFASGSKEDGRPKIGFHCFGAEHVCGYHIIVNETAHDLSASVAAARELVYSIFKSRDIPPHDTIMRLKNGAALQVTQSGPSEAFASPHLIIDILKIGDPKLATSDALPRSKGRTRSEARAGSSQSPMPEAKPDAESQPAPEATTDAPPAITEAALAEYRAATRAYNTKLWSARLVAITGKVLVAIFLARVGMDYLPMGDSQTAVSMIGK